MACRIFQFLTEELNQVCNQLEKLFQKAKSLHGKSICLYFEIRAIYLVITANVHKMIRALNKPNKLLHETAILF